LDRSCVTTFKDADEALEIANDTLMVSAQACVDARYQPRLSLRPEIKAGRVWTNCYHLYRHTRLSGVTSNPVSAVVRITA
jgi:acyl-CoA reductase-like NAD-dependent aldehyde dehydrogenase